VFPVRYEVGSYIPEEGILHSHRRENPRTYKETNPFSETFSFNYLQFRTTKVSMNPVTVTVFRFTFMWKFFK
jgi:hypothetical protein